MNSLYNTWPDQNYKTILRQVHDRTSVCEWNHPSTGIRLEVTSRLKQMNPRYSYCLGYKKSTLGRSCSRRYDFWCSCDNQGDSLRCGVKCNLRENSCVQRKHRPKRTNEYPSPQRIFGIDNDGSCGCGHNIATKCLPPKIRVPDDESTHPQRMPHKVGTIVPGVTIPFQRISKRMKRSRSKPSLVYV